MRIASVKIAIALPLLAIYVSWVDAFIVTTNPPTVVSTRDRINHQREEGFPMKHGRRRKESKLDAFRFEVDTETGQVVKEKRLAVEKALIKATEAAELAQKLAIHATRLSGREKADNTMKKEEETSATYEKKAKNNNAKTKTEGAAPTKEENQKKTSKKAQGQPAVEIDISKLDIRVGVIKKAWEHEEADKLFCEEIDIGEEEPRKIASGLRAHYNLGDLQDQRVLVLANLKARKLIGFPSHGMVLCASSENGVVKFVEPPEGAEIGERVMVDGFDGEPATENQVAKKKILDKIFPELQTNSDGVATYRGAPLTTSAGPVQPSLPDAAVS